jgi:large subunit ribosomal protein L37Ae
MSKRTKKVGTTGWMGPRYGTRIRRRTQDVEKTRRAVSICPKCSTLSVSRVGSGIWQCRRCERTFASDAYVFKPAPSIFRVEEETVGKVAPEAGAGRKVKGGSA